jgi:glycosyltransferase involved in cell wall biosynthesis
VTLSLICTVLNEAGSIDALLDSIARQGVLPDELVFTDAGSRDDTVARIQRWAESHSSVPTVVLVRPGANISAGRNAAIRAARGDVIAVTDAGVHLPQNWLAEIVRPLRTDPSVGAVSGFFQSSPTSTFELALGATTLPDVAEITPQRFLPSSRSIAFRRAAWQRAGGYPEWLDYCEDLIFDVNLRRTGCRFAWAPAAMVEFRPRASVSAFWRQYFRYARGDGKAKLWPKRHAIRYATYLGTAAVFALLPKLVAFALIGAGAAAYSRRPLGRLWRRRGRRPLAQLLMAGLLVAPLRAVGDVAKMAGYPLGRLWRLRNRPPRWDIEPTHRTDHQ